MSDPIPAEQPSHEPVELFGVLSDASQRGVSVSLVNRRALATARGRFTAEHIRGVSKDLLLSMLTGMTVHHAGSGALY